MNCHHCSQQFDITQEDLSFYDGISPVIDGKKYLVPPPDLCTNCGHQQRTAFRNERYLYKRKCDLSGKDIVSIFSPDKPYTVYDQSEWWGDNWNPLDYGQDFDFSRPFFPQFQEILQKVPLLSNMVFNSINCEYNSFIVDSKDCYLSTRIGDSEDVVHSFLALHSTGCYDCYNVSSCQYCYECIDCQNCYGCKFCTLCKNCSDCTFCLDCTGCKNCFGCVGLRNAEFHFFNKKYTKEEYEKLVNEYNLGSYRSTQEATTKFENEKRKYPVRDTVLTNAEESSGDYITNSKNVKNSFDVENTDTAKNSWGVEYSKNINNCDFIYYGENCYQNIANAKSSNIFFSFVAVNGGHNLWYSMLCFNNVQDCFGSVSLKQKKNCILNKQYSPEDYEKLMAKIIQHMQKTGEWGKFFPAELSTFGYNETVAQAYFPLTNKEVTKRGWKWHEEEEMTKHTSSGQLPDDINEIDDSICKQILICEVTGKQYKIVPQELAFYKKMGLSIPRKSPDQRYKERMDKRNPRKLRSHSCDKCAKPTQTTVPVNSSEKIHCEKCYLEAVY